MGRVTPATALDYQWHLCYCPKNDISKCCRNGTTAGGAYCIGISLWAFSSFH